MENNIQKRIMLALSKQGVTIFRNNTGMGWAGEAIRLQSGDVLIKNPRPLHAGLCVGSSDLIGFKPVKITPDMVGKTVAVFTAVEVKTPTGRASKEQLNFIDRVKQAGGNAGVARNEAEAEYIVR